MNTKMMAILFASGNENKFNDLTIHRTTTSMPFAGRYRLVDFALSSFVNSGATRIGIITRNNYSSLMDHIRMGRDWDLNRKNSGIAVFPPFGLNTSKEMYKGKIEALHTILDFIEKAPEDYVILSNGNTAANIDYTKVLEKHIESGADLTILCHKAQCVNSSKRVIVGRDKKGFVNDLYSVEIPSQDLKLVSLGVYVVAKSILLEWVQQAYARGFVDFETDILFKEVKNGKLLAYEITEFAAIIDDVKTYYAESMKVLDYNIREQLFGGKNKIFTKVKDSVPTIYGDKAVVVNSLIADGCTINGTVINSILFRNVKVEDGVVIRDSIVMEDGTIMENSQLSHVITDKRVTVQPGRELKGLQTYTIVVVKNKVV